MDVADLQEVAVQKSRALGHVLTEWARVDEGDAAAWRATCVRCAAVVYVRSESGLLGVAGTVLTDRCPGAGEGDPKDEATG